ncbi:MAG: SH3 domain-containing protein [Pseudomonadota bacterium]
MSRFLHLSALFAVIVFPTTLSAETLYVNSPTADLKSSTAASASVLAQLPRGTGVNVIGRTGSWVQVNAGGKTGFVYKFKLVAKKPSASGGSGLLAGLGGGGATAREGSTATSIRGLSPTSEKYAGRAAIKPEDVKMVKHMESVRVSKAELDAFLKDGKLGEYAQ